MDPPARAGLVTPSLSLTMLFFVRQLQLAKVLKNPTIVLVTDRNDLDEQLFGTFADHGAALRGTPRQAGTSEEMRRLLAVDIGGLVFTTIQRFGGEDGSHPLLTDRSNGIVIADEAHRTQYGFKKRYVERDGGIREAVGLPLVIHRSLRPRCASGRKRAKAQIIAVMRNRRKARSIKAQALQSPERYACVPRGTCDPRRPQGH